MIPTNIAAAVLMLFTLMSFGAAWQIQDWRFTAQIKQGEAKVARAAQQAEARARAVEQEYTRRVEEIADHAAQRRSVLEARAAAAERSARSLRDDIARLNARPAPSNPEAARFADEASRARELLGTCATEYRGVAVEADALRDQVTGLQEYARAVLEDPK